MFHRLAAVLCILLLATASRPASAFTPESGFYWNAAEAGRGFTIEIQDNFLFMIGYVYRTDGSSTFVTTQGQMSGNTSFTGMLDTFSNGQCITCPYTGFPTITSGGAGPVSLVFTSETTATMTWNGGTVPLQRFDFFLTRNAQLDPETELLLGEWQNVLDYSEVPQFMGYPFFGDVLVFDTIETGNPDLFVGCRAENSFDGRCTTAARTNSEAAGYRDAPTGFHVIVVDNDPNNFLVYVLDVGTSQYDGFAATCPRNQSLAQCLAGGINDIAVRGWRSASRSFVQTGIGPNGADGPPKARISLPSLPAGNGTSSKARLLSRYGMDISALDPQALERAARALRPD